ncbi:MAG: DNA/RNA non-specific endonuclease [Lactobacillus equicursoris]|uniref:DNA/RNA non-specific endonuclease n=1 Tax=Lactobacillus equicursoris TaxID=420645 RepID=UPI00242DC304|nr:DNA/RNA non-specific endonuclease [Lactobacillus equicursoris]MDD6386176.1 DNA/RNA non-specific endonuclease [Lactobacillus equicursoris]MDD6408059.1 DNA/RNA non-specific endonuclease [Lactobacillus equicursoris]
MARKRRRRKSRKQNTSLISVLVAIAAVAWGVYTQGGQKQVSIPGITSSVSQKTSSSSNISNSTNAVANAGKQNTVYGGLAKSDYQKLAKLDFKSGGKAYIYVNNNHSTLVKSAWKVNRVIYSNLDKQNRTSSSNTAFLEKRNLANDSLRVRQYIQPTGWHSNSGSVQIYNRGHLIAYSVSAGIDQDGNYNPKNQSGDQNNPKNLFTQSAFSNQKIQTIFESKVRAALRQNKKVIYQATPIFRGTELMARGINLQAVSTDGTFDFNVYLYNVQPGYVFDYATGRAKVNRQLQVTE